MKTITKDKKKRHYTYSIHLPWKATTYHAQWFNVYELSPICCLWI